MIPNMFAIDLVMQELRKKMDEMVKALYEAGILKRD
jgi:hypothetical protein